MQNSPIKLAPMNALAEKLLEHLAKLGVSARYKNFGGKFCLAVKVCNPAEAVMLGMDLGGGWGDLGFDTWPNGAQFVVFRDALVQAA